MENVEELNKLIIEDKSKVEIYTEWKRLSHLVDLYKICRETKNETEPKLVDDSFLNELAKFHEMDVIFDIDHISLSELKSFQDHCNEEASKYDIVSIERKRLLSLLRTAGLEGTNEQILKDYEMALQLSYGRRGYEVVLKRDIDETMINNYNPEWIVAWDSNMDIQVCLDYFAVITYITDYYMKDETGTLEHIKAALQNDETGSLKQQMNLVKNTFLTHRQAGECEIYYKLFPFLNLTNSNITAYYIPTGFKKNMSRFLKAISAEEACTSDSVVEIEGREGKLFIEMQNIYEKFLRRHEQVKCITYIQFAQRYDACRVGPNEIDWENEFYGNRNNGLIQNNDDSEDEEENRTCFDGDDNDTVDDDFIYEYPQPKRYKHLPKFIPIYTDNPQVYKYMKLRSKRVIRFHKFKETNTPHEFYFSEMQKYYPFQKEEELFPDNLEKCHNLYEEKIDTIQYLKSKVMPHIDNVIEGRERAEQFISDIGDELDANNEIEQDRAQEEGNYDNPEMAFKNPQTSGIIDADIPLQNSKTTFRKIEVQSDNALKAKLETLDPDQRRVIDIALEYAQNFKTADNQRGEHEWPIPPRLLVLGNGGTGKSHVIDIASQLLHKTFCRSGDNPDHPYVLKLAFTGNAALIIKGQTINSVFNLPFSNSINSLGDKIRDLRRTQLQNLRLIILDEISLVKSDMLYQIHFRLAKDIKQNDMPFGNIGIICFGDLLQIKPPLGSHVFETPKNEKFRMEHSISPLWNMFSPIILKTNHRQGEDKEYAEICNRAREGILTNADKEKLNSRVYSKDSPDLPKNALFSSGTNKVVCEYNIKKLNEMSGELHIFDASVFSKTKKESGCVPTDSGGMIKNSGLPLQLKLKIGARVYLTHNIDVVDGLANGTMGIVIGFKKKTDGKVKYVIVRFDDIDSGKERRKQFNFENEFPGGTPIDLLETDFSVSKQSTATRTAINFPLRLGWATTLHRIQGHTIKKPKSIILYLKDWIQPSMIYTGLSRVQSLNQLFIIDEIPFEKIYPWQDALEEYRRLQELDVSHSNTATTLLISENI